MLIIFKNFNIIMKLYNSNIHLAGSKIEPFSGTGMVYKMLLTDEG